MAQGATITWDNEVRDYFTQMQVGCMRQHGVDLASYASVRDNADEILARVSMQPGDPGFMPAGGSRWAQAQIDRFKQWIDAGMPET